jgi:prefoldin subunit 5
VQETTKDAVRYLKQEKEKIENKIKELERSN